MKRKKKDSPRAQMTCLTLFGPVLVVPSPPASDGQGFRKPHGYTGMGTEGKGQGTDLRTLEKPIPSSRVRGYLWYLLQVFLFLTI